MKHAKVSKSKNMGLKLIKMDQISLELRRVNNSKRFISICSNNNNVYFFEPRGEITLSEFDPFNQ